MNNDFENPMAAPFTRSEEMEMLSDEDIKELPTCNWCGEKVYGKYKKTNMHPACWHEGKAEHDCDR